MVGIYQIGKEVVVFHFCLRWVHHWYQKTFFDLNMEIWFIGYQNFKVINGYNMITKKHMAFYCCWLSGPWLFHSEVCHLWQFHSEICHLKEILKKNTFPIKLIDSCIKTFLRKRFTEKTVRLTAEKKGLVIVLPFLGKLSLDLRLSLKASICKNLPFCKIWVIFKSSTRIFNFF